MTAPLRFRHPIRAPEPIAARQYRKLIDADGPPTVAQGDQLGEALWRGDPLFDAYARSIAGDHAAAHRTLERAIAGGIATVDDASPELRALFDQLERVPLWVEPRLLDIGGRAFVRTGPVGGGVLQHFSLMGGYRSSAVAKTLVRTGKLTSMALKRLLDTIRFLAAVNSDGALQRGHAGYRAVIHTRMIHTMVRAKLARDPAWRTNEWGLPINQADMLATNLAFSYSYLHGARALGVTFSDEEAYAVIHLWRYIGYLIGIEEGLLPATESEAARINYMVLTSQPPGDDDSVALARALADLPHHMATTDVARRLAPVFVELGIGISRVLLGDEAVDELGFGRHPVQHAAKLMVPAIAGIDRMRRFVPGANALALTLGRKYFDTITAIPL
jgi:hypothetical protein